jgi:YVTN family beta-propeller protein
MRQSFRRTYLLPALGLLGLVALLPLFGATRSPAQPRSQPGAAARVTTARLTLLSTTTPKAYVGLFGDNAVAVIDTSTDQVLRTIAVPAGPHGIVITPDGARVYVSSDGDSVVSVIDTASDAIVDTIQVGQTPHGLAITPDGREVLVAGFGASQVSIIDTATDLVTAQLPVPNPHNIAISPGGRLAYVVAQAPGETALAILDLATNTQTGTVPLDKMPRALNFSPDGTQLYFTLAGSDAVQVLDPTTNQVVARSPSAPRRTTRCSRLMVGKP